MPDPRFKSGDPVIVIESSSQFTVGDTAIVDDDPYAGTSHPSGHSHCMIKVTWTASSRGTGRREKIYERRLELMRPERAPEENFTIPPCSRVTTSPEKIWELLVNASTAGSS